MVWPAIIGAAGALAGGALSGDRNRKSMHEQMDFQREMATHGIRWKVADAKAAGIHPLYALGASTSMPSPIAIQDSYGPALAAAGQDLGRAFEATRTPNERESAQVQFRQQEIRAGNMAAMESLNRQAGEERLVGIRQQNIGQQLDNELKRLQINRMYGSGQLGPGMPNNVSAPDLVPSTGAIKVEPSEVTSADPNNPGRDAGKASMFRKFDTGLGFSMLGLGKQSQESFEDALSLLSLPAATVANIQHFMEQIRNSDTAKTTRAQIAAAAAKRRGWPTRKGL